MKEKKLIAMFITSIIAFVASLTITLGITLALADPVAAIGLAEISYNVSTSSSASKQVVFNPVGSFNGNVEDYIFVNSYDNILYANETVCDSVKLLKVSVTNDASVNKTFAFTINVSGKSNAVKYAKFAIVNINKDGVIVNENNRFIKLANNDTAQQLTIKANSTAYFVVVGYIADKAATEVVDLSAYMDMKVTVERIDFTN